MDTFTTRILSEEQLAGLSGGLASFRAITDEFCGTGIKRLPPIKWPPRGPFPDPRITGFDKARLTF
jgi:hypothetical protein